MLYFAYGSNLNTDRLTTCIEATALHTATIADYALSFNKLSVDSSAKANIMQSHGDNVLGVIYRISRSQLPALNKAEGKGYGYSIKRMHTVAGERVFLYVADEDAYTNVPVYTDYMNLVIAGMQEHNFSTEYIADTTADVEVVDAPKVLYTDDVHNAYTAGMLIRKHIIITKYFRKTDAEKQQALQTVLQALNAHYGLQTTMRFTEGTPGSSNYRPSADLITMHTTSLMTFIHEYAHALQTIYTEYTEYTDAEEDAQSWSHTVFFIAAPQMYLKAKNADKFNHDNVQMLAPFSNATEMPADNVLKNRFYRYFDTFVKTVRDTPQTITVQDLHTVTQNHASLTQHLNTVFKHSACII